MIKNATKLNNRKLKLAKKKKLPKNSTNQKKFKNPPKSNYKTPSFSKRENTKKSMKTKAFWIALKKNSKTNNYIMS